MADDAHAKPPIFVAGRPVIGVLLCNLGSPTAPTAPAVRRFLAEFLSDRRVVDLPRALWWLMLHGVILRIRPGRVAKAYRAVWREDGAPLTAISGLQATALQRAFDADGPGRYRVELAMRYGKPTIAASVEALRRAGCERIVVLPLYPQYSSTTTASVFDAVADALAVSRWYPELRMIRDYHVDDGYIAALATSVREGRDAFGRPDRLLISMHGIPQRLVQQGDAYAAQCEATAAALAGALELDASAWRLGYQSRFGREPWLGPSVDEVLADWGGQGVAHIQVVCPGFAADCLETLEEVEIGYAATFREAGGERFDYVPALNDRDDHVAALVALVGRHTDGWD